MMFRLPLIGIVALLASQVHPAQAEPSHRFQIGPVAGLTTIRHDAPATAGIPRGATVDFIVIAEPLAADFNEDGEVGLPDFSVFAQCFGGSNRPPATDCPASANADLDADGDVDLSDFALFSQFFHRTPLEGLVWTGAAEVQRTPFQSVARATFPDVGNRAVAAALEPPSAAPISFAFVAEVIDVAARDIEVSPITLIPSPVGPETDDLSAFYGPSIAQVREVGPHQFVTSIERPLELGVVVTPSPFEHLLEWRVNGSPTAIGSSLAISFDQAGQYNISASGRQSVSIETYEVILLTPAPYHGAPPAGPLSFLAVTNPPGHEGAITWIADTLHGTATILFAWGGLAMVEFADTSAPDDDVDGIAQWYGVRADNATSGLLYFVDQNAATADDSNSGTRSAPWRTLAPAGSRPKPGDTVYVRPGVYTAGLKLTTSGTIEEPITYCAVPRAACQPAGDTDSPPVCGVIIDGARIDLDDHSYVRVEGFELRHSGDDPIYCQGPFSTQSVGVEIVNNYVHNNQGTDRSAPAIRCENARDYLVAGNFISDITGTGIDIRGLHATERVTIRDNVILRVDCDGIDVGGTDIVVENNVIGDSYDTDCHQDALEVYGPVDRLVIRNNRIWDFTQCVYLSAEEGHLRDVEVLGNVVWCEAYCDLGNNSAGLNVGPNVADITNLRVEGNTFYNVWCLFTDAYARNPSFHLSGLEVNGNIFAQTPLFFDVVEPFGSDRNLFFNPGDTIISVGIREYRSLTGLWNDHPHFELNSTQGDPMFLDSGRRDFRPLPASPAIDRGPVMHGLTHDPHGNPRPQGNGYDIGAYELILLYDHQ